MTFYPRYFLKHASIFIGAFFCLLVLPVLLTAGCKEKPTTPDWTNEPNPNTSPHAYSEVRENTQAAQASKPTQTDTAEAAVKIPAADSKQPQEIRFLAYNLRNYLTMRRYSDGKVHFTSKPEEEITHLIQIIQNAHPDILGVCEIGTASDLKDFQTLLKKAGLDLPFTHRVHGSDRVRALAILSRFPIASTAKPKSITYQLKRRPFQISRGVLDATIQLPNKKVRFIGVHFKSKRPVEDADQEMMRRNESLLVRQHIDQLLTNHPETPLLVYGDFNDSKGSKALYTLKGREHSRNRLNTLELTDSRGESWTHHWKREAVYSRFDYIMVNTKLSPSIDRKKSCVLDPKIWEQATDHRALLVIIN